MSERWPIVIRWRLRVPEDAIPFRAYFVLAEPVRVPSRRRVQNPPDTLVSDRFTEWCTRLRDGDQDALASLFHHMHESLVAYGTGLTNDRGVARDLVQETFVKIWENRHQLDPNRSLRALLFRMVRNRALNLARDEQNRSQLLADHIEVDHPILPDAELDGTQLRGRLQSWMDELPERQREALRLSRFEGLAHDEIAEVMEISPRTVNNHLVKALRHLRQRVVAYEPQLLMEH